MLRTVMSDRQSVSFSHAILAQTKRLNVIAAILPGPWNPTIAAKTLAGIDIYTGSRISVNVVSGWFKQEFISIGEEWLEVGDAARFVLTPARRALQAIQRIHQVPAGYLERGAVQLRGHILQIQGLQLVTKTGHQGGGYRQQDRARTNNLHGWEFCRGAEHGRGRQRLVLHEWKHRRRVCRVHRRREAEEPRAGQKGQDCDQVSDACCAPGEPDMQRLRFGS